MGTVFRQLAARSSDAPTSDDSILALLAVFWPMIEKLFLSEYTENANLSVAACKALSEAIRSSGIYASYMNVFSYFYCLVDESSGQ